jgi:site-specific DNA recombinase
LRERPGGLRLLADAKAGAFDIVLVYKLDRIGRSLLVVIDAHDRLGEAGVALKSATEPIDTSTAAGRLIFQMLASFSEFERATIAERSRDGLRRAFKEGRHIGRIPYGYDVDKNGALVVVEDEACVVRQIIANVAGGSTLYSEAKRLNDEGQPSPGHKYRNRPRKYGPCWHPSSIRSIVAATTYSGVHTIRASGGAIEREVPVVIEPGLREKALARLAENKLYAGGKPGRKYLLRGLVTCAYCGTACVGDGSVSSMGYRYHYYSCRKKRSTQYDARHSKQGYSCPKVKAEWLEELVWADVRSFLESPGEVLERVREQLAGDREGGRPARTSRVSHESSGGQAGGEGPLPLALRQRTRRRGGTRGLHGRPQEPDREPQAPDHLRRERGRPEGRE